jgi:two-component system sensor kinase FixL
MKERYKEAGEQEAINVARSFLFDIAHTIGKMDARSFHEKMNLRDPIEKLSAGPIHFAFTGWAFVDIFPQSKPTPDENYFLLYDHPFSFESHAWLQAGKKSDFPVCVMNAGYSSGWCEESFGVPLLATEITCKARGDDACRFIMAHPSRIEQAVRDYLRTEPELARKVTSHQMTDLIKYKNAEEALRAAQAENRKLAAVASRTHSSVMIVTPDGRIDWVNDGFTRVNELDLAQVKGRSLPDFLADCRTDPKTIESVKVYIRERRSACLEIERFAPSGKHLWLDVEVQPILDDAGRLTHVIVIETDITERHEAQNRQARLLDELGKANNELSDFAHIVSHDLKAPLRSIKSLVQWIAQDCKEVLPGDSREQMDLLTGRVDRMQKLIEGILQYSRAGRAHEDIVLIDLNNLLSEVIDLLDPPKHITIRPAAHLPVIYGERTRIQQVFQNLLSNAIKYMDKPKGRITVDFVEQEDSWQFSVADNGPGIEEKYFDQIFGMFRTLHARDEFESTGVGLTVVKKIVEHCGGKIWVESEVGKGSTFLFTLSKHTLPIPTPELSATTA